VAAPYCKEISSSAAVLSEKELLTVAMDGSDPMMLPLSRKCRSLRPQLQLQLALILHVLQRKLLSDFYMVCGDAELRIFVV
jgi:hypothetical protein